MTYHYHLQILEMLDRIEVKLSSNGSDSEAIRKAITAGFFTQVRTERNVFTIPHSFNSRAHV
jgi:hypothetical protein